VQAGHLTRKDYVDSQDATKVAKAGDTMTGPLTIDHQSPSGSLKLVSDTDTYSQIRFERTGLGGSAILELTDTGVLRFRSVTDSGDFTFSGAILQFNNDGTAIFTKRLTVNEAPSTASHVVRKTELDEKVDKAGDTITGALLLDDGTDPTYYSALEPRTDGGLNIVTRLRSDDSVVSLFNMNNAGLAVYDKPFLLHDGLTVRDGFGGQIVLQVLDNDQAVSVPVAPTQDDHIARKVDVDQKVTGAGLTIWKGTQAEFDAIVTKNPNTVYLRTA
jgi:hypothetical protein